MSKLRIVALVALFAVVGGFVGRLLRLPRLLQPLR